MMIRALVLSAAYLIASVHAHAAAPLAVAVAREQFVGALLVPQPVPEFKPTGLLLLNYTTAGRVANGDVFKASNVSSAPEVGIKGTTAQEADSSSPYYEGNNATVRFTVIAIDANYPGSKNPDGYNVHWLANGLSIYEDRDHWLMIHPTEDTSTVIPYAGPNPPAGTGPHRYVFLAYREPADFVAPDTPAPNSGVGLFNLTSYVATAKIGAPIAGLYFTVQSGDAVTVATVATTSVVSTTLAEYTPTSTASTTTTSGSPGAATRVSPTLGWLFASCLLFFSL